jgi:ABC-type phosphate transport system auxiliary subunit
MIFKIGYAVALLEKLCDSQGLDYSEEKKHWQARAQKYQEQYEAEKAEKEKAHKALEEKIEAERAAREEQFALRQAERKARLSEHYPQIFD